MGIKACLDLSGDAGHLHRAGNVPRTLQQPLLLTCTEPQHQSEDTVNNNAESRGVANNMDAGRRCGGRVEACAPVTRSKGSPAAFIFSAICNAGSNQGVVCVHEPYSGVFAHGSPPKPEASAAHSTLRCLPLSALAVPDKSSLSQQTEYEP